MNAHRLFVVACFAILTVACGQSDSNSGSELAQAAPDDLAVSDAELAGNPFREDVADTFWGAAFCANRNR